MNDRFRLASEDCAFLSLFKEYGTLTSLCNELNLDKGFVSRRLSKIAVVAPVLEKAQGKWALTSQGEEIVRWYREAAEKQNSILTAQKILRLATSQTFSERRLTAQLSSLKNKLDLERMIVKTDLPDIEHALLSRQIDGAIVCQIPKTPDIRYKRLFKYPFTVVAPAYWKKNTSSAIELLKSRPYVSHMQMSIRAILGVEEETPSPVLEFDHVSGVRQAVLEGLGWSILPHYAVDHEISKKQLIELDHIKVGPIEEFQFWWIPGRLSKKTVSDIIEQFGN